MILIDQGPELSFDAGRAIPALAAQQQLLQQDSRRRPVQSFALTEALGRFAIVAGPARRPGGEKLRFGIAADLETAPQVCLGLHEITLFEGGMSGLPVIACPELSAEEIRSKGGKCQQAEHRQETPQLILDV